MYATAPNPVRLHRRASNLRNGDEGVGSPPVAKSEVRRNPARASLCVQSLPRNNPGVSHPAVHGERPVAPTDDDGRARTGRKEHRHGALLSNCRKPAQTAQSRLHEGRLRAAPNNGPLIRGGRSRRAGLRTGIVHRAQPECENQKQNAEDAGRRRRATRSTPTRRSGERQSGARHR